MKNFYHVCCPKIYKLCTPPVTTITYSLSVMEDVKERLSHKRTVDRITEAKDRARPGEGALLSTLDLLSSRIPPYCAKISVLQITAH